MRVVLVLTPITQRYLKMGDGVGIAKIFQVQVVSSFYTSLIWLCIEIMRLWANGVEGKSERESRRRCLCERARELLMPNYATLPAGGVKKVVACVQLYRKINPIKKEKRGKERAYLAEYMKAPSCVS
jgi:hypothetical protein